jgi:hypothetical protein
MAEKGHKPEEIVAKLRQVPRRSGANEQTCVTRMGARLEPRASRRREGRDGYPRLSWPTRITPAEPMPMSALGQAGDTAALMLL